MSYLATHEPAKLLTFFLPLLIQGNHLTQHKRGTGRQGSRGEEGRERERGRGREGEEGRERERRGKQGERGREGDDKLHNAAYVE